MRASIVPEKTIVPATNQPLSTPPSSALAWPCRTLRFGDRLAALTCELGADVVLDPLRVPPLDRQDGDAVQIDAIVQMIAGSKPGLARLAKDLPLAHRIADLDIH